jgi:hypothetical protein
LIELAIESRFDVEVDVSGSRGSGNMLYLVPRIGEHPSKKQERTIQGIDISVSELGDSRVTCVSKVWGDRRGSVWTYVVVVGLNTCESPDGW